MFEWKEFHLLGEGSPATDACICLEVKKNVRVCEHVVIEFMFMEFQTEKKDLGYFTWTELDE